MSTDTATDTLVRVAVIRGPSYAGHSQLAATPVHLLRLGICNLSCDWCPVPETVAAHGAHLDTTAPYTTTAALHDQLGPLLDADPWVPLLITGGEPLLQDYAILDLTQRLRAGRHHPTRVWVATNGTRPVPAWWHTYVHHTIVSPKVGTHDPHHKRLPHQALTTWAHLAGLRLATFNFDCATPSDVTAAAGVLTSLDLSPSCCTITPRGRGHDEQLTSLAAIIDTALSYGFGLTPRPAQLLTNPIEVHRR